MLTELFKVPFYYIIARLRWLHIDLFAEVAEAKSVSHLLVQGISVAGRIALRVAFISCDPNSWKVLAVKGQLKAAIDNLFAPVVRAHALLEPLELHLVEILKRFKILGYWTAWHHFFVVFLAICRVIIAVIDADVLSVFELSMEIPAFQDFSILVGENAHHGQYLSLFESHGLGVDASPYWFLSLPIEVVSIQEIERLVAHESDGCAHK